MKVDVEATGDRDQLAENLEKRVESVEKTQKGLSVETTEPEILGRTPGVASYTVEGEEKEGIHGEPVDEQAYIRIESREDVVKAFLATVDGYNLVVLNTEREWDLKRLKRFNPDIKHLKSDSPVEELGIELSFSETDADLERKRIDLEDVDVESVYRFIQQ
jgi:hypothetical protein